MNRDDYILILEESIKTKQEMLNIHQAWLVETNSVYNKLALRRARSHMRKYFELSKKFNKLTSLISQINKKELYELKELIEQKTTSVMR